MARGADHPKNAQACPRDLGPLPVLQNGYNWRGRAVAPGHARPLRESGFACVTFG